MGKGALAMGLQHQKMGVGSWTLECLKRLLPSDQTGRRKRVPFLSSTLNMHQGKIMSPLVEAALKSINSRTNISTGLSHPNDMNAAKEMFVHLRRAGEILLASEIQAFAEAAGWQTKDAEELGSLAQQIGEGANPRISGGPWWKLDIIEILQR
jgi:hypothetical protein